MKRHSHVYVSLRVSIHPAAHALRTDAEDHVHGLGSATGANRVCVSAGSTGDGHATAAVVADFLWPPRTTSAGRSSPKVVDSAWLHHGRAAAATSQHQLGGRSGSCTVRVVRGDVLDQEERSPPSLRQDADHSVGGTCKVRDAGVLGGGGELPDKWDAAWRSPRSCKPREQL